MARQTHTCTLFLTSCRCCSSICCFSVTTAAVGCVACPPCCRGHKKDIRQGCNRGMLPPSLRRFGRVFSPSLTHTGSWLFTSASAPARQRIREKRGEMGAPSSPHPARTPRLCPGCQEPGWEPWDSCPLTWAAVAAVCRRRDSSQRQRATMRAISIGFSRYLLCKGSNTPRSAGTRQPTGSPHA